MASAVSAIWRKGRRSRRISHSARVPMINRTARLATSSTRRSDPSVSLVGFNESATYILPWGTSTATVRYCPSGSPLLPTTTAFGSGRNVPA